MATAHTKRARESYGFLILIGGILVLLNILGIFFFARLDLTENRLFSLSDGSKRLSSSLEDNMEIVAYFTENLPPPFNATQRYVRDILAEYAAASNGKIQVRYVNPDSEEKEEEARNDGVQKVSHQVVENDGVNVREGYRGIAFRYLGNVKSIGVVEDTSGLEYQISQLIKEMHGEKAPVGILSGHEGPTMQKGLSGLQQAAPTYEFRETSAQSAIDPKLRALLIVEPTTPLTDAEVNNIKAYLNQGGSVGIFGGGLKMETESQSPNANYVDTKVNALTEAWGLKLGKGLVADAQCGRAPMQTAMGIAMFVPYPPVPIVSFEENATEHPALFRLRQVVMPFTSPVSVSSKFNSKDIKRTVLAKSSQYSWLISEFPISLQPRHPREWTQTGRTGPFALAAAVEGKAPAGGKKSFRSIVVGTAGVLRDEFLPQPDRQGKRDLGPALAFALNAIDWLAQDADLIAIRAKSVEDPALRVPTYVLEAEQEVQAAAKDQDQGKVEKGLEKRKGALKAWEGKKALYRWLNTLGLPVIFALFGVFRWRSRQSKKAHLKI